MIVSYPSADCRGERLLRSGAILKPAGQLPAQIQTFNNLPHNVRHSAQALGAGTVVRRRPRKEKGGPLPDRPDLFAVKR